MSKPSSTMRRRAIDSKRRVREFKMIAKGLASKDHPILAHIIPIRRCNLSCDTATSMTISPSLCRWR